MAVPMPTVESLAALRLQKYGHVDRMGPLPLRRHKFGYSLPADIYESLVSMLVGVGDSWLDVGGGRALFAHNPALARTLAARCARVVAVDPSNNVLSNQFVHEAVQTTLEEYMPAEAFDLATMRMVVEHVSAPEPFVAALARLVKPGGVVVVFTVSLWSPLTILSRAVPYRFHHALKSYFWGGKEGDTFPAYYLMNTRASLSGQFERAGFVEELFAKTDDLSLFGSFQVLGYAELLLWRGLNAIGLPYPERTLLAVYRKRTAPK